MKQLIGLLFIFIGFGSQAQKTPAFLTTFYFADAIGNLDSIEIGFDSSANPMSNPEFGEISKLTPFDSVLDVRAVEYYTYYNTTPPILPLDLVTSRIVRGIEKIVNGPCYATPFYIFFIHAKNQPITISVKSISVFQKIDCPKHNTWNFFSPDRTYHFIEPWGWAKLPGVRYGCLKDSTYSLFLDKAHIQAFERPYVLEYEVEGVGKDTILGVCFSRDQTFYQCDSTYIGLDHVNSANDFLIYPNPFSDFLKLQLNEFDQPINYQIISQNGKLINGSIWPKGQKEIILDLFDLQAGAYFLKLNGKHGSKVKYFIKI